jgi:nucleotide-binding universal stress UspA family protein
VSVTDAKRGLPTFTTIVWATDGSTHADRALEYASEAAEMSGGKLLVVHIVEKQVSSRVVGQNLYYGEDEIEQKVNDQAAELAAKAGFQTELYIVPSTVSVAKRIAQIARDASADVIIIGTRGRSALTGALRGSVTQRLLGLAHCPILAIPPLDQTEADAEADEDSHLAEQLVTEN